MSRDRTIDNVIKTAMSNIQSDTVLMNEYMGEYSRNENFRNTNDIIDKAKAIAMTQAAIGILEKNFQTPKVPTPKVPTFTLQKNVTAPIGLVANGSGGRKSRRRKKTNQRR